MLSSGTGQKFIATPSSCKQYQAQSVAREAVIECARELIDMAIAHGWNDQLEEWGVWQIEKQGILMSTAIDTISNYVYGAENSFSSVLVDRSLNFEREAGFAVQALTANDYAMGMAVKNKQSVINAVTNIAAIGISLNPAKRQAYLVPP